MQTIVFGRILLGHKLDRKLLQSYPSRFDFAGYAQLLAQAN